MRIRTHDLIWLLPLGQRRVMTLATDTDASAARYRATEASTKDSVNASNALLRLRDCRARSGCMALDSSRAMRMHGRTGILSGEALADSGVVVEEVTKIIFRRERPLYNNAAGDFFAHNTGIIGCFQSSHSMLAWTLAGVVAGEYPSDVQVHGAAVYDLSRVRSEPGRASSDKNISRQMSCWVAPQVMADRALRLRKASCAPRCPCGAGEARV